MKKVSIIGAGNVGASAAMVLAESGICDIVLLDIDGDIAKGKALDISQALAASGSNSKVIGTDDYSDIKDSSVIVITAGVARKPGMTREELLEINKKIASSICKGIKKNSPDSIVVNVANPMDAITAYVFNELKFSKSKIIGMGGVLDGFRFVNKIKKYLSVNYDDITPMVVGMHGEKMVPVPEYTTISGVPLISMAEPELIDKIVNETINGGAEIVGYLKTGSAYYAPAQAIKLMVESILNDSGRILCCAVNLSGEYGYNDLFLGVPVQLGSIGVKQIIELEFSSEIRKKFDIAANVAKKLI
ncbi:MAG: malate dehydrogenase [Candidatus Woesearchaeota archaeon]